MRRIVNVAVVVQAATVKAEAGWNGAPSRVCSWGKAIPPSASKFHTHLMPMEGLYLVKSSHPGKVGQCLWSAFFTSRM
jgi:hypothetical protein